MPLQWLSPTPETGEVHRYAMDFPNYQKIGESEAIRDFAQQVFRTGRSVFLSKEELAANPKAIAPLTATPPIPR
jgi:hypothetical protein